MLENYSSPVDSTFDANFTARLFIPIQTLLAGQEVNIYVGGYVTGDIIGLSLDIEEWIRAECLDFHFRIHRFRLRQSRRSDTDSSRCEIRQQIRPTRRAEKQAEYRSL